MKLKRCPFCNSHSLDLGVNQIVFWIQCHGCGAQGPMGNTKQDAADYWNGKHRNTNSSALVANRQSNHHDMKEVEI